MNVKVIGKIVGKIMILEGILMFFPFVVSIIYKENYIYILSFLIPSCCLIIIGKLLQLPKAKSKGVISKRRICGMCINMDCNDYFWCFAFCDQSRYSKLY